MSDPHQDNRTVENVYLMKRRHVLMELLPCKNQAIVHDGDAPATFSLQLICVTGYVKKKSAAGASIGYLNRTTLPTDIMRRVGIIPMMMPGL